MMKIHLKYKLFLAALMVSSSAFAQSELLDLNLRPRIADVLDYHEGYRPDSQIPIRGGNLNYPHFREAINKDAPNFISQLERAYPGATFAFMGRDTQVISDIVDAFYLSIGQPNRVVQIGMSKTTLVGVSAEDTIEYLKYFGLDLDKIDSSKPFILVDTVSTGEYIDGSLVSGRQGRHLLQVIYKAWIDKGRDPKELLQKVNMVGMQVSTFKTHEAGNIARYRSLSLGVPETALSSALKANQDALDLKDYSRIGQNMVLALIPDTPSIFNESGYDHYTGAWHDRFQPPQRTEDGLIPNPGPLTDALYRKSILWLQHQIIDIAGSLEFHQRVEAFSRNFDVKFPVNRTDYKLYSCKKLML